MDIQRPTRYSVPPTDTLNVPHRETNQASPVRQSNPPHAKRIVWRLLVAIFFILLMAFAIGGAFVILKTYSTSKKITIRNEHASFLGDVGSLVSSIFSEQKKLRGESDGRINILLLGAAGKGKPGQNLTDTVMIMSIDTENRRVALLSLPRDLYVNIPQAGIATKINSVYQFGLNREEGLEPMKQVVENVTGLPIHYFLVIDFAGFTQVIDDLGGVNVTVTRDIHDSRFPGPNYSYETFDLKKGLHVLDGKTALKYVRERHNDPEGDFGRAKRQQQVIQAVKNKAFSLGTFLNVFRLSSLLDTLGDNVKTDIALDEVERFIALAREVDTQNITNVVVDAWKKDSLLKVSHVFYGSVRAFILVPRVGNFSEIHDLAANIFDLNKIKERQAKFKDEGASIAITNQSGEPALLPKIQLLLRETLGLKTVTIVHETAATKRDATVVTDNTGGAKLYTLDELLKRIPATLDKNNGIINTETDFTIFLGSDIVKTYLFDEDSVEEFQKAEDTQEYFEIKN